MAGAVRIEPTATGGYAAGSAPYALELTPSTTQEVRAWGEKVPVVAGRRYFFSAKCSRGTTLGAGSRLNLGGRWLQADGTTVVAAAAEATQQTPTSLTAGAVPKLVEWSETAPAGAAFFQMKIYTPGLADSSGTFRVESPRVSTNGAVGSIQGPTTKVVRYDYLIAPEEGELPSPISYSFLLNGVSQASGVTWTYKVLTGIVNGFDIDDGSQSMTGTGPGTFTVTSVGTDTATVQITATAFSVTTQLTLTITRSIADPPSGGGGGGGPETIATDGLSGSTSSATFADKSGTFSGTIPTGNTSARVVANCTVSFAYDGSGNDSTTCEFRLMRNISGTWTQIGSTVTGVRARGYLVDAETDQWAYEPGNATLDITDTGLTAGITYQWRIEARRSAGSFTAGVSGAITVTS